LFSPRFNIDLGIEFDVRNAITTGRDGAVGRGAAKAIAEAMPPWSQTMAAVRSQIRQHGMMPVALGLPHL
jgi:hypothetical protein